MTNENFWADKLRLVQLTRLVATHFRNFSELDLEFATPVTAFVGANAQGKTNILEAIQLISLGKSLRTNSDQHLIQHDADFFRVTATTSSGELEVAARADQKSWRANGKKITGSELIGRLPTVAFFPEDLNLILLGPAARRRYLDVLLSQISHEYLQALSRYTHALRQRNALLVQITASQAQLVELEFWDLELARSGSRIGQQRAEWLATNAATITKNFCQISGTTKQLVVRLVGSQSASEPDQYLAELERQKQKDLRYGVTSYGPHRADLGFELDLQPLQLDGSRGEIRSAVLALRLAELAFIAQVTQRQPLLLLDDVFSELDRGRQDRLMGLLAGHQTFITTTKLEHLEVVGAAKQIWQVEGGRVFA